jgi:hypothetical protein
MSDLTNSKMLVQLASFVNIARFDEMTRSQQLEELCKPHGNIFFEVKSFKEAAYLCLKFIDRHDLGSSNWAGGLIVNEKFEFLAKVSYNGRVWDSDDCFKAKEIKL